MNFCPNCSTQLIRELHAGRERDLCPHPRCDFVHWNNPIPVVAAVVYHGDEVALVRNVGWPTHWYALVTGFLESGEMPEEAVLREVAEEIGLDGRIERYLGMYEFYRSNQLIIAYAIEVDSKDTTLQEDEIVDIKWKHIEDVKPWSAGTGRALQEWLATRGVRRDLVDINLARN